MSALVVTVLIALVWGAVTAAGYVRGGWREIVTLAGLLLSGAMLAEWAGPNGADLAGLFDGDVYRSSTAVAFLYLVGGTLLLGYFGGSRLPRPAPLSATERFAGGALGFLNGGLLAALALRALRSYAFRPGDGAVLAETPLAAFLTDNAGYLIAAAMLAGAVAPFVSAFLLRGSRPAAEYAEEPSLAAAPYVPVAPVSSVASEPEHHPAPALRPAFAAPFTPPPAVPYLPSAPPALPPPRVEARSGPPPGMTATPPRAQPLIPAAPSAPIVVAAATLPTPALPPAPAEPSSPADDGDTPTVTLAVPPQVSEPPVSVAEGPPPGRESPETRPAMPPGFGIAASQPLPVVVGEQANAPGLPALPPSPPVARETQPDTAPSPVAGRDTEMKANDDGPTATPEASPDPPESFIVEQTSPSPTDTDGLPIVPPPDAHGPDDLAAPSEEPEPEGSEPEPDASPPPPSPVRDADKGEPDAAPRVARARVAAVRQPPPPPKPLHMTVPPALQRPVQPGPQMHPCPVCDYPVRNEARFCPNCGTAQPVPATYSD